MTIYWERCDICGRYLPVRQCTMDREIMVCPHCCLTCPRRSICPDPVWKYAFIRVKQRGKIGVNKAESDKTKVFQELLSKLGS